MKPLEPTARALRVRTGEYNVVPANSKGRGCCLEQYCCGTALCTVGRGSGLPEPRIHIGVCPVGVNRGFNGVMRWFLVEFELTILYINYTEYELDYKRYV